MRHDPVTLLTCNSANHLSLSGLQAYRLFLCPCEGCDRSMPSYRHLSSRVGRALLPSAVVSVVLVCPHLASHKLKLLSWTAEASPAPSEASRDDLELCCTSFRLRLHPSTTSPLIAHQFHPTPQPKIALITGITWQEGSYLAELLLEIGLPDAWNQAAGEQHNTGRIDHFYQDLHESEPRLMLH